ncbi:MAG: GNAT family N-acetyltransferase [Bacteroidales bacterium]|jgi:hypothetical protein|nr:GNAT family N-acetyltransferase [Bacteroidales bacterium]
MLYEVAHIIKDHSRSLWDIIEWINSEFFSLIHKKKLKDVQGMLERFSGNFIYREALLDDAKPLAIFFSDQPKDAFKFFNPHDFDEKSLKKLIKRKSFLTYLVLDGERIVGYYFLRSFVNGKCFLGKMVDYRYRGRGIGKDISKSSMEIARHLGMMMFETISKDNMASLKSTKDVLDIKIIKDMPNNYLYIQDFPKETVNTEL